jgi:hypothetical protein
MKALTRQAIDSIKAIYEGTIIALAERVPREWLAEGDAVRLLCLLERLEQRRTHLASLVARHLDAISDSHSSA